MEVLFSKPFYSMIVAVEALEVQGLGGDAQGSKCSLGLCAVLDGGLSRLNYLLGVLRLNQSGGTDNTMLVVGVGGS